MISRLDVLHGRTCSIEDHLAAKHVIVSQDGELSGVIDDSFAQSRHTRYVVLLVPLILPALVAVTKALLSATIPTRFATEFAGLFGLEVRDPPVAVRPFDVRSVPSVIATTRCKIGLKIRSLRALAWRVAERVSPAKMSRIIRLIPGVLGRRLWHAYTMDGPPKSLRAQVEIIFRHPACPWVMGRLPDTVEQWIGRVLSVKAMR